jgi:hypothetical protein
MYDLVDENLLRRVSVVGGTPNCVKLKEHDPGATFKELVITHLPADAVICDLDPIRPSTGKKLLGRYSWFFQANHEIAPKQCDGLVSLVHLGVEYLIAIEMKSSASGLARGRLQLESGKAFAGYISTLLGREIRVCRRLVFAAPPSPSPARVSAMNFPEFKEIPVYCRHGTAHLSMGQLAG